MNRVDESIETLREHLEADNIRIISGTLGRQGKEHGKLVWVVGIQRPDNCVQTLHVLVANESPHDSVTLERVARRIRVYVLDGDVESYPYTVRWSTEDGEYVGTCPNFSSLSCLAPTDVEALAGIKKLVREAIPRLRQGGG